MPMVHSYTVHIYSLFNHCEIHFTKRLKDRSMHSQRFLCDCSYSLSIPRVISYIHIASSRCRKSMIYLRHATYKIMHGFLVLIAEEVQNGDLSTPDPWNMTLQKYEWINHRPSFTHFLMICIRAGPAFLVKSGLPR